MRAVKRGDYPEEWDEVAAEKKRQARGRCERCGHPHDVPSHHVLTVHHLDGTLPKASMQDLGNCWWNLVALCQRCHLSVQAKVRMGQLFLYEDRHSWWLVPYLAGRRAWERGADFRDHSDRQWVYARLGDYVDVAGLLGQPRTTPGGPGARYPATAAPRAGRTI